MIRGRRSLPWRRSPGPAGGRGGPGRARSRGGALGRPDSSAWDLVYKGEPGFAPRRLRPATEWVPRPMNSGSSEPWLQGSRVSPAPVGPRLPAACPGRPFLSFGQQGGVIYREDENLSRKFVPINIPVPGSSSSRRGRGQGGPCSCSSSPGSTAGPRLGAEGQLLGPHADGRSRTCSDAQGTRARRLAREQRAAGPGGSRGRDQTMSWDAGGGWERDGRDPCLGEGGGSTRGRRLGCAAPPKRKLVWGAGAPGPRRGWDPASDLATVTQPQGTAAEM